MSGADDELKAFLLSLGVAGAGAIDRTLLAGIAGKLAGTDGIIPSLESLVALGQYTTWSRLGTMLLEAGYLAAARTAYTAATASEPQNPLAHVNLGNAQMLLDNLSAAEERFRLALLLQPGLSVAHQGLASVYHRQADPERARQQLDLAFRHQAVFTLPFRGHGTPVRLLILASAFEGNVPWHAIIDSTVFQVTVLAVEYFDVQLPLPPHQLIFNAIGDGDLCPDGLRIAQQLIENSAAAVVNRPAAVMRTGRLVNAERLAGIPGMIVPRIISLSKSSLSCGAALDELTRQHLVYPFLLRAPGFHGGSYFSHVDSGAEFESAWDELPGDELLAIEFLEPEATDGLFRKYRVMSIDGTLYPLHMAVSRHWKVHYFSSEMQTTATFRGEEQAFLDDFRRCIGPRAVSALERIGTELDLDYCGIDFGLDRHGNLLLYEANASMAVVRPSDETLWDYRRAPVEQVLAAIKGMLLAHAAGT